MASDPTSYANNTQARVKSFHLQVSVNFAKQVLSGHVDHEVEIVQDNVDHVVFDSRDLTIHSVLDAKSGQALEYKLGEPHAVFGSTLTVTLPKESKEKGKGGSAVIRIAFDTSPSSAAIQWLPPSQTSGKQHPYLFTQCQAIHARSLFPCQDTPSNKSTYTATVTVDAPLVALMSALQNGQKADEQHKTVTYEFKQPVPMCSYLVALAVGALEKRDIGPRSAVWSEKETVDAGAHEFAETEKFIKAAEDICGPYAWGRYDILLLPPSFPYGGMENPCLTFVTPTLLAGDRSLANVVAHEIAHSWMGNLVSNRTWEHFWMNEGFCVFLERKIMKSLYGNQVAHLHAISGWKALKDNVGHFGHDHDYTRLNVPLKDVDPDDAFSSIPYEKGFNFLHYLEGVVGGSELMDKFLFAHCEKYKFATVDSQEWKEFFLSYFKDKVDANKLAAIDWESWYHKPGMPPVEAKFDTTLVDNAHTLATQIFEKNVAPKADDIKGWTSHQVVAFLEKLQEIQKNAFDAATQNNTLADEKAKFGKICRSVDEAYHLTQSKNAEIRFRWYVVGIRADMEEVYKPTAEFLGSQGRMKFTRVLYRELFGNPKSKDFAVETFKKHQSIYHNICAKMVAKDLKLVE